MPGDDVLEQNERANRPLDAHAHESAQHGGHLDDAEARLPPLVLVGEHDPEVDGFVAKMRERMARIDGQGREDGEDIGPKALIEHGEIRRSKLFGADDDDARSLQRRDHLAAPILVRGLDEGVRTLTDGNELLVGEHAVRWHFGDGPQRLGLEARNANHEKLVEV